MTYTPEYERVVHVRPGKRGEVTVQLAAGKELTDATAAMGVYYCTPSRHQAQAVEVSYSGGTTIAEYDAGDRYMRVIDHSTGERWYYELAEMGLGEMDWEEPAGEGL